MVVDRKDPQVAGHGLSKESAGDNRDVVADSVIDCRGAIKSTATHTEEVMSLATEVVNQIPGNTFACLVQREDDCNTEAAESLALNRFDPNTSTDYSDSSPILETFKHIRRVDELDFTPVPLSKKKIKQMKKRNLASKQVPVVRGSTLLPNG